MDHLEKRGLAQDPTAEERKQDHIELAFSSQVGENALDSRFYYEPLLSGHPNPGSWPAFEFLGKAFRVPLWVSSMTGGTGLARTINHNLARACAEFGMGMGLGSCRQLLYSNEFLADFAVRPILGDSQPLFANLGVAQLEELIDRRELDRVSDLIARLDADGLIIHVNPLQEWLQPEGDRFLRPPLETIETLLEAASYPVIVKEVGQGMGPESLRELLKLPLAALDFAAAGGTNFARLELLRGVPEKTDLFGRLAQVGHTAVEMVDWVNALTEELGPRLRCRQIIVSGGIKGFLDGYYAIRKLTLPAIYGQASGFLQHARGDYEALRSFVSSQVRGLEVAQAFLKVR